MNLHPLLLKNSLRVLLVGASLALIGTLPTLAQDTDEWFDPTDWFAGQNVKTTGADKYGVYDYGYDYGLGENFDYAEWSSYGRWGYEVWNANDYDADYWDKQKWVNDTASLEEPEGKARSYVIYAAQPQTTKTRDTAERDKQTAKSDERPKQTQAKEAKGAQKQKEDPSSSDQAGRKQVARLEGKIDGLRNLQLRRESGAINTYTVAKVRLGNDKTTVVNLGREALVKDLNLKKGDVIESIGRRGKIAGRNVFVAHRLKAGNRTIDANPTIRLSDQSQQTLAGTVTEIKKGTSGEHTLVTLKLDNEETATIDLGPAAATDKIGLEQGERVNVRGRTKDQGNRQILIPDLLKVESETSTATDSK